jgi:riboflavin synthase
MFTGLVAARGRVRSARRRGGNLELTIEAPPIARELRRGDSVAVGGVCLTAVEAGRRRFVVHAVGETLARTTLGDLERSQLVNLELPVRAMDRLGGHLVQGHVDGVARALRVEDEEGAKRVWWAASEELLLYVAAKGSVALDGVSLTVVEAGRTSFQVALIPETLALTTLSDVRPGSTANLEVDVIAKYVERLASGSAGR